MRRLGDDDYRAFERLQALHNTISASKDSFLDLGALTRVAGAVALSTITVVATSFVQSYLQRTF